MAAVDVIQDLSVMLLVAAAAGWLCQRLGIPVVFGYIVAGLAAGPSELSLGWIDNTERIRTLWEIGLVFLMFSTGLRLSVRKLSQIGFSVVFAVGLSAPMVFGLTRLGGALAGLLAPACMVLAAVMMVSSTAVVTRVLQQTGLTHERSGQLAMGITSLEDVLGVLVLTILGSVAPAAGSLGTSLGREVGSLGAFVVLAGVLGLLLVSRLLRKLNLSTAEELQSVAVAALLFGLALIAQAAGFSLALGAFLIGVVIGGTAHRTQVERAFEGMRDVFTAVFFVAVGLQADLGVLIRQFWVVLAIAAFAISARAGAVALGLSLTGVAPKHAISAGLVVIPLGEFAFIIIQLAIAAALVPAHWFTIVVGVAAVTTLVSPALARFSGKVAAGILARPPGWLRQWHGYYSRWIERLRARQKRNRLWALGRKRLVQVAVEVLFVTGLMIFSEQLHGLVDGWLGHDWLFPHGPTVLFLIALLLLVLAPLVAIWRNVSALCLIIAQETVRGLPGALRLAPVVERVYKTVAVAGIYVWLSTVLPIVPGARWGVLAIIVVAVLLLAVLRRRFVYWHSELEVGLQEAWQADGDAGAEASAPWLRPKGDWGITVVECVIPDLAPCRGHTIAELALRERFGCTVAGIERQGYAIALPGPDEAFFPRDRVLLLGASEKVAAGRAFLQQVSTDSAGTVDFDDMSMEILQVPSNAEATGKTLKTLAPLQRFGVQIAGIRRGESRILNPTGEELLTGGDEILVLGTPAGIRKFEDLLDDEPSPGL